MMMMFKHDDGDDVQAFSLSAFKPSTVKQFEFSVKVRIKVRAWSRFG